MHTALSFLSFWNPANRFLVGKPEVLVENGQILQANLIKFQISTDELLTGLREKGFHNLADVEFAMLEPNGKLSVAPKSQARPVTPKDLHLATNYEGMTAALVVDGMVDEVNLKKVNLDRLWLLNALLRKGAPGPEAVLYAGLDTQGNLLVVRRQDVPLLQAIFQGAQVQSPPGLPPQMAPK